MPKWKKLTGRHVGNKWRADWREGISGVKSTPSVPERQHKPSTPKRKQTPLDDEARTRAKVQRQEGFKLKQYGFAGTFEGEQYRRRHVEPLTEIITRDRESGRRRKEVWEAIGKFSETEIAERILLAALSICNQPDLLKDEDETEDFDDDVFEDDEFNVNRTNGRVWRAQCLNIGGWLLARPRDDRALVGMWAIDKLQQLRIFGLTKPPERIVVMDVSLEVRLEIARALCNHEIGNPFLYPRYGTELPAWTANGGLSGV